MKLSFERPPQRGDLVISEDLRYVGHARSLNEALATGDYLNVEDFQQAAESIGTNVGNGTYAMTQLTHIVLWDCFNQIRADNVFANLKCHVFGLYDKNWKQERLLLRTQKVADILAEMQSGVMPMGLGRQSRRIIQFTLQEQDELGELAG